MSRVVVITGGGRGIGATVAVAAARRGWKVAVGYQHNHARAQAVAAAVAAAGGQAIAVAADIADEAAVMRLFATVDKELGRPWGLVNSAGIIGPSGRIDAVRCGGS